MPQPVGPQQWEEERQVFGMFGEKMVESVRRDRSWGSSRQHVEGDGVPTFFGGLCFLQELGKCEAP